MEEHSRRVKGSTGFLKQINTQYMGTRADFYIRKDNQMKWVGSKGYDGYPDGIDESVLKATTEQDYEAKTIAFLKEENDATFPEHGWPWPWKDSRTTDYAYIFENDKVMSSCFGGPLFDPLLTDEENEKDDPLPAGYFPDMKDKQNIAYDNRSGALFISVRRS
jgi:hypothetical protein